MQSTRERILNYLKTNQQITAAQLAAAFNKTQANIRYHLDVLQEDGHIEIVGLEPQKGAGRPTNIYMLTKESQDNALDALASALLDVAIPNSTPKKRASHLQAVADKLIQAPLEPHKAIPLKLSSAVQRLEELQYKARWEAHRDGPKILFAQCPYAQIINQHPELCEMDALMISSLTGLACHQELKISRSQSGPDHCQFILYLNSNKEAKT